MIVVHVYVIYTTLTRPPKDKIALCICAAENLFFWINTNPQRHGSGQLHLVATDHHALSKDCFLDCSRVTTFAPREMGDAKHRGAISADLARRVVQFLQDDPPRTLSPRFVNLAIANLSRLFWRFIAAFRADLFLAADAQISRPAHEPRLGRYMFHVDLIRDWLVDSGGSAYVTEALARRRSKVTGQHRLRLVVPENRPTL